MRIEGTFDVTLVSQPPSEQAAAAGIDRRTIAKRFHGGLDATSAGEMIAAMTTTPGSGGYVALERVSGTLDGRRGGFVLQHTGTLERGRPALTVTVVPDSGTDALVGLTGTMTIDIVDGGHRYTFDCALPDATT